jgi:hypothetical protein
MHAQGIIARVLGPCLTGVHAKRAEALLRATAALLCGGRADLSAIALRRNGVRLDLCRGTTGTEGF